MLFLLIIFYDALLLIPHDRCTALDVAITLFLGWKIHGKEKRREDAEGWLCFAFFGRIGRTWDIYLMVLGFGLCA